VITQTFSELTLPGEDRQSAQQELFTNLVALCPDGIIGVDRGGTVVIFNQAAEMLSGFRAQDVLGKLSISDLYRTPELAREVKRRLHAPDMGGPGRLEGLEVELRHAQGHTVPIRLSATLLVREGQEIGSVGFFHDMTQRKRMEDELRRHSITDSLTGLFNRRHLYTMLSEEVPRAHRYGRPLTLVVMDLDGFKPFNDTYGHHEGDSILKLVGASAQDCLRAQDFAFRHGGDEFAFVMVETTLEEGRRAAGRLQEHFQQQWGDAMGYLGGRLEAVTMSLGAAQLAPEERVDKLILRADLAMYEAKKAGGNQTVLARPEIGAPAESNEPWLA